MAPGHRRNCSGELSLYLLQVGTTYSASSYPASSPSEELAREAAAAKLLLMLESAEGGGVPTSAPAVAMQQLTELVAECEAGLWATTVPHMYRYSNQLHAYCNGEGTRRTIPD